MSENPGPWDRPPNPERPGRSGISAKFPVGVLLWLALLFAVALGLWLLAEQFPGRLSSGDGQINLIRGLSILALLSSGLLFVRRINVGEMIRNIAIWTGAAAVLILVYTYRDEISDIGQQVGGRVSAELLPGQPVTTIGGSVTLIQGRGGHFIAHGRVNGATIPFMIDTGATGIVLSPAAARAIGLDPETLRYTQIFHTANGIGYGAPYRLKHLSIGHIGFDDVAVSINKAEMSTSLLGMSFLNRLSSFEIRGQKLILRP